MNTNDDIEGFLNEFPDSVPNQSSATLKSHHSAIRLLLKAVMELRTENQSLRIEREETAKVIRELKAKLEADDQSPNALERLSIDAETTVKSIVSAEMKEAKRIEKNIVITGLVESEKGDDVVITELFTALKIDKSMIKRHRRIKKRSAVAAQLTTERPAPLIIELNSVEDKYTVCNNAHNIQTSRYPCYDKVYINHDQTSAERAANARLRKQRNERNNELPHTGYYGLKFGLQADGTEYYYGIRFGRIVKINRE